LQDIQEFLDGAQNGAIYFSMGSILRSDTLPKEKIQEILSTFAELKQRIIWKWESDELTISQPPNIKIGKWLPQQDILGNIHTIKGAVRSSHLSC
jgi:glucuronosyltransferase